VADRQQAPVGRDGAQRVERLDRVEALAQRRVHRQQRSLRLAPRLRRQLRRLARPHPRAEQDCVEVGAQALDRDAGDARLLAPPLGQAARCIRACAMRLGLRVTK